LGGVVRHTYTQKLVYVVVSMRDAEYQTCLRQVLINIVAVAVVVSAAAALVAYTHDYAALMLILSCK